MAYYYNPPQKSALTKAQILKIQQQNQLKFSSQQSGFATIILLNMKNTKVNDQSTTCLNFIQHELKIQTIDLSQNFSFITDATIQNLCSCKGLISLKSLNLADDNMTDLGIEMLSNHSNFQKLKTLIVYGNSDITDISFLSLAKSEWIKTIQKLDFHATSIKDKGLTQFIKSQNSKYLTDLNVSMNWNRITNLTLESIGKSPFCKNIKILNLQDCSITDLGIELICLSQNSWNIENLNIGNSIEKSKNRIGDKSLECIAYSKMFNLKTLYLKSTDVTGKGIKYLTSSPVVEKLETLKISHCKGVGDQVLGYFGMVIEYTSLSKLHVNSTGVTKEKGAEFQEKYPKVMIIY